MPAYLALWGIFTAVMFVGTFRLNRALQVVFGTLTVLFFLLAYGDITERQRQLQTFHRLRRTGLRLLRNLHRAGAGAERTLRQSRAAARHGEEININ